MKNAYKISKYKENVEALQQKVNAASDIWKKLKMSNLNTHRLLIFRERYFRKVVMFFYRKIFSLCALKIARHDLCIFTCSVIFIYRLLLIWWRKRWRRASPRKRYFLIVHEPLVYIEIVQFQEKRLLPLSNSTQWSQINEYRETFNRFDADGNGSIDAEELGKLIRVLGWVGI